MSVYILCTQLDVFLSIYNDARKMLSDPFRPTCVIIRCIHIRIFSIRAIRTIAAVGELLRSCPVTPVTSAMAALAEFLSALEVLLHGRNCGFVEHGFDQVLVFRFRCCLCITLTSFLSVCCVWTPDEQDTGFLLILIQKQIISWM